ncbi:PAC2 family protein [Streptomyces buecherae]|uniref:PAC2 family protein n=1 Tax=Streptomyces buecherae TaxID=2763006 RepID=A0A7H8NF85_9ACTN|nr:PAC2 family protein [Streptomyces buecherae]QKW53135.1 PAC2 family protein [Streptomyces buecherae]
MIELEGVPELIDPVMICAFEGWNDAGDAASTAVGHLDREWKGEVFAALDAEDYYDFQVNRPTVWLDGGVRKVTWPTTRLSVVRTGGDKPRDLVLVRGIEPSMRWRSFCNEILGFAHELGVEMVVVLGALLGDTPHTRPVPVSGVTSDPDLARSLDLEESRYEGPTGIVGILQESCTHAGVPAVSLWAAVPHYVSQPPNPKATLALLNRLEDLLELRIPLGELPEDARAWQLGVDQLAAEDSEVAEYVQSLEEARDTAELPEASGEAIAREFERYLRRRDGQPGPGGHASDSGVADSRDSYLRDPGSGRARPTRSTARDEPRDEPREESSDAAKAEPDGAAATGDGRPAGGAKPRGEEAGKAERAESRAEGERAEDRAEDEAERAGQGEAEEGKPERGPDQDAGRETGGSDGPDGPDEDAGDEADGNA